VSALIIAEAGVNHNGDLALARGLIDAAAEAGADLVKFQTFNADRLVTAAAVKAAYQTQSSADFETQHAMLRRLELTREMHQALIAHCKLRGIEFFSSGFDLESVALLVELGADRFKIPSGEITNLPYLRLVGSYGRPVILSSGMATLREIEWALQVLQSAGTPLDRITVLHCNTEYPTPMADVNLRAMNTIAQAFGVAVGYSDHTLGIEVAIAAVALGACVIEKHFTLDRTQPGPDHKASLEPREFAAMVLAIRNIEAKNMPVARKSLVAAQPIRAGEIFSTANLAVKRPGTGLSPARWDEVIGRRAPRDFAEDEFIEL
jgi:N,N'-diacetyllegionaminate synthase